MCTNPAEVEMFLKKLGNRFRTLRHEIRGNTGIIILPIFCPSRDNFRHAILVKLCRRHYISVEMIRIYLFVPLGTNKNEKSTNLRFVLWEINDWSKLDSTFILFPFFMFFTPFLTMPTQSTYLSRMCKGKNIYTTIAYDYLRTLAITVFFIIFP